MSGYRIRSDDRGDLAEIFPDTLAGLEDAIMRAREVSAVCSPREVVKSGRVIRRYEDGMWTGNQESEAGHG